MVQIIQVGISAKTVFMKQGLLFSSPWEKLLKLIEQTLN